MKTIYNVSTGEEIVRELTAEELDQQAKDEQAKAPALAEKAEVEAKRDAAKAKLAALGLDEDDLKVLGF